MQQPSKILIVDDEVAQTVANQLRRIFEKQGVECEVHFAETLMAMHDALQDGSFSVLLLDHYWQVAKLPEILDTIALNHPYLVVAVFTGKSIETRDVLECSKLGVIDYFLKTPSGHEELAERLYSFAKGRDAYSISRLRAPSGTLKRLQSQCDSLLRENDKLKASIALKSARITELQDEDYRNIKVSVVNLSLGLFYFLTVTIFYLWVKQSEDSNFKIAYWVFATIIFLAARVGIRKWSLKMFGVGLNGEQGSITRSGRKVVGEDKD